MTEKTKISSLKTFDMADHLRDEADINEYFSQVLEEIGRASCRERV